MSLLAGVTTERSDKFNDMYYQKPSWFARKYVYHDTKVRLCPEVRMIMINDVTVFAVRASGTPAQTSSSMPRQPRGDTRSKIFTLWRLYYSCFNTPFPLFTPHET